MSHSFITPAIKSRAARCRSGFSLLELMIVVAIIVILVGLTLAVITPILLKNEDRTTRNILTQLDAAVQEWERTLDRRVTFQNATAETGNWDIPFNPDFNAAFGQAEGQCVAPFSTSLPDQRTVYLFELMGQQASARDLLAKIPSQFMKNVKLVTPTPTNGEFTKLKAAFDAWGTPIVAVFPGREPISTDPASLIRDIDGTIRCATENGTTPATTGWGVCRNRQILFVSAGPDQLFTGNGAADNVYSYGQEGQ